MGVVYSKIYFRKPKIIQTLSQSFAVSIYHYSNKFIYFKFKLKKKCIFKFMLDYKLKWCFLEIDVLEATQHRSI